MSDFRILELPVEEHHIIGYIGKWSVTAQRINPRFAQFLGVDGTIVGYGAVAGTGGDKIFEHLYFATEEEAHLAAWRYYSHHAELYPYIKEWKACMPTFDVIINIESQIMEFI